MDLSDREQALRAVAICDQIESHLRDENPIMVEVYKAWLEKWAHNATRCDLLVWCQAIRRQAEEILREDDDD